MTRCNIVEMIQRFWIYSRYHPQAW